MHCVRTLHKALLDAEGGKMRGWGKRNRFVFSFLTCVVGHSFVYADDAKALQSLVAHCAYRVHANIFREQAKLAFSGNHASGPRYHDSEIEMTSRPGVGQLFVTGPTGSDFGMIEVGKTTFGFARPQFEIHNLGGIEGALKAIKFDGLGQYALGIFEPALKAEDPQGPKALVLLPLQVTDNQTGAMAPLSASVFALPIEGVSKIKIWAQEGTHRFFMTDGSNNFSTLEISENGEIKRTGSFRVNAKIGNETSSIKIHQVSFFGDGQTGLVHFEFGSDGKRAVALAKALPEDQGALQIDFKSASILRDGKSQPKSIAIQPYTNLIYINYENGYDIFSPEVSSATFRSVGTYVHPVSGVESIQFHWQLTPERQIIVTPTFAIPDVSSKATQVYWGEPRVFQMAAEKPKKESHRSAKNLRSKKPRVVLQTKSEDGGVEQPAELGAPPTEGDSNGE